MIRDKFSILNKNLVYLDNASGSLKPDRVLDTMNNYYYNFPANIHRGSYKIAKKASAAYEESRQIVSQFINCDSDELIFTSGTTEGFNLLASCLGQFLCQDDEIILSELDHHSNILPWQLASNQYKFNIKYIPLLKSGELDLDLLPNILNDKTKAISITLCSNLNGYILDLNKVKNFLKERKDVLLFVDAAQAAAHMILDVKKMKIDALSFSGHKIYGPTGVGALYLSKKLQKKFHPYKSGGGMINNVSHFSSEFIEGVKKFEAGTPNIAGVIGFSEACLFLKEFGLKKIFQHENKLRKYLLERLKSEPGVQIIGENKRTKTGVVSFICSWVHPHDLSDFFGSQDICVRSGQHCCHLAMKKLNVLATVRISLGVFNNKKDIDLMMNVLKLSKEVFCV